MPAVFPFCEFVAELGDELSAFAFAHAEEMSAGVGVREVIFEAFLAELAVVGVGDGHSQHLLWGG